MHKENRICPICKQNGKDTSLELRQINLTEAVYICQDRNCIYPIGFQWEYVKNNILDDSDDSSDDSIKQTTNDTKLLHEKPKNITNKQSVAKTCHTKEKLNIISNVVLENPEQLRNIINKKNCVKTNEILTRSTESVRKNSARFNNKTKVQSNSGALPESVVKNAKALSKYFSSTTNQSKKPKTTMKTVFDIIQQPPVVKIKQSSDEEVLSDEANDSIISNTSTEHNYSIKSNNFDDVDCDNKYIDSFFDNEIIKEEEKINNEVSETFDELLFSNEDKCDTKNQSLDLSEMDELLSFL